MATSFFSWSTSCPTTTVEENLQPRSFQKYTSHRSTTSGFHAPFLALKSRIFFARPHTDLASLAGQHRAVEKGLLFRNLVRSRWKLVLKGPYLSPSKFPWNPLFHVNRPPLLDSHRLLADPLPARKELCDYFKIQSPTWSTIPLWHHRRHEK